VTVSGAAYAERVRYASLAVGPRAYSFRPGYVTMSLWVWSFMSGTLIHPIASPKKRAVEPDKDGQRRD
jgi:hypothetical protein